MYKEQTIKLSLEQAEEIVRNELGMSVEILMAEEEEYYDQPMIDHLLHSLHFYSSDESFRSFCQKNEIDYKKYEW